MKSIVFQKKEMKNRKKIKKMVLSAFTVANYIFSEITSDIDIHKYSFIDLYIWTGLVIMQNRTTKKHEPEHKILGF